MPGGRPINLGLTEAISRIGGYSAAQLPALLDGIQPVMIYGDVSKSVASEVFEARGVSGFTLDHFAGLQIQAKAPGGIVIETCNVFIQIATAVGAPWSVGINITTTTAAGLTLNPKLDVGGIATASPAHTFTPAVAAGALLALHCDQAFSGVNAPELMSVLTDVRMYVPPGHFFQIFPFAGAGTLFQIGLHVVWRELSDIQGAP